MPDPPRPWLSIVTVVKDDAGGFSRTVDSLDPQDLDGVEWIVVDSSSDRKTIPDILGSAGALTADYSWIVPAGVYPAMNVGIDRVTGDYVYFLNAGDAFHDADVIANLRETLVQHLPQWMYGQVTFVSATGRSTTPPPFDYPAERAASFSRGRFPPHQGTVVATTALRSIGGFDTTYRVVADYAVFLRLSLIADPIETPIVIADFFEGGVSTTSWRGALKEFHRARREILRPRGTSAVREWVATSAQWLKMAAGRTRERLAR